MNQKNLDYLKNNLKYMGFGDKLNAGLEKEMSKLQPAFQLKLETEMSGKAFAAVLNFRKGDNSDNYFFNSYHASLQRSNGEITDQAFYLANGKGVTAKEAFNLLDGRAVFKELTTKEGQPFKAWIQLDFTEKDKHNNHEVKQYHENYGFDLKGALAKYGLSEMKDPVKEEALLHSLQKGNLQSVSIEKDGGVVRMFVEANPKFKSVNLYDAAMNRANLQNLTEKKEQQGEKQEEKKELKQGKKAGGEEGSTKQGTQRKGKRSQKIS